jgi:O-6-methylguanine DNA methyltransferase
MSEKIRIPKQLKTALDDLFLAGPGPAATRRAAAGVNQILTDLKSRQLRYARIENTPIGTVYLAARGKRVIAIDFGISETAFTDQVSARWGENPAYDPGFLEPMKQQVLGYLHGEIEALTLSVDLGGLTDFQKQVLQAACEIPRGTLVSYADIARKIENPRAVRAVGQALGRNPIPILIPCHRVIASDGGLGGYSGGGGLETKRKLLILEGALLA